MNKSFFDKTKHGLIVSCQALENEPLHSSFIMSKMAYAAYLGGAVGIRANSVCDIIAIKQAVNLPIIGIIKKVYENSNVYITPTIKEVNELMECGVDVIAMDATKRKRFDGRFINDIFIDIRKKYPEQLFMADCSNYEEAVNAKELGFDIIGTTLSGYTEYTMDNKLPDIELIKNLGHNIGLPVIAEGGIWGKKDLATIIEIQGVHCAVIGSAITRPMEITKNFVSVITKK